MTGAVCRWIIYIAMMIICSIFASKLSIATFFEKKEERKALLKIGFSFIAGFILGGLYFIGFDLN